MKCITGVSSKLNPQLIVGKYGTSSICSARMIHEIHMSRNEMHHRGFGLYGASFFLNNRFKKVCSFI